MQFEMESMRLCSRSEPSPMSSCFLNYQLSLWHAGDFMLGKCVQSEFFLQFSIKNKWIYTVLKFESFHSSIRIFNVDNHITVYPSNYRGRPVTKGNIQDYISNIVSKYLPIGLPPWQICVIPVIRTVSSARPDDTASIPSTSAESMSGNETEEEQQTSSDSTTAVRQFWKAFARLKHSACRRACLFWFFFSHTNRIRILSIVCCCFCQLIINYIRFHLYKKDFMLCK